MVKRCQVPFFARQEDPICLRISGSSASEEKVKPGLRPGRGVGAERGVGGDRIQLKEPGQEPSRAVVAAVQLSSAGDCGSRTFAGSWTAALDKYPDAYFLTANTPSPFNFAVNPACCSRFATSLGTFRPLVSLFGVPV